MCPPEISCLHCVRKNLRQRLAQSEISRQCVESDVIGWIMRKPALVARADMSIEVDARISVGLVAVARAVLGPRGLWAPDYF